MKAIIGVLDGVEAILERKIAELNRTLRGPNGIQIERSADQMDEIQYASERDLAIGNVDRESTMLREVKAALRGFHKGTYGTCVECESPISQNRLAAVPWALRCIRCQESADRDGQAEGKVGGMHEYLADVA
jgi:DnaK suppressor protein